MNFLGIHLKIADNILNNDIYHKLVIFLFIWIITPVTLSALK